MKLFLDDERQPKDAAMYKNNGVYMRDGWVVVKNYQEFTDYFKHNEMPELISFDHDLTDAHYVYAATSYIPYSKIAVETGYHCLLWLILFCANKRISLPQILIHTMNVEGTNNMNNLLDAYKLLTK